MVERMTEYICPTCSKSFENAMEIFSHLSQNHTRLEIIRDFVYKYVSDELIKKKKGWKIIEECSRCGEKKKRSE